MPEAPWAERLARPVNATVVRQDREYTDPLPDDVTGLDRVFSVLVYHDFVWMETDRAAMNADLFRALHKAGLTPRVEFLRLSSYGNSKESSGEVLVSGQIPSNVEGRHVLVVDDILDTGRSLAYAKQIFVERGAAQVSSCVLLDKPARREVDVSADFTGFEVEDLFVVGYGIDYADDYRYLPYIGTVD